MDFRLNRRAVRRFRGFPPEEQNEGYAEHAAMSAEERIALTGHLLRQYVVGVLSLPRIPPMDRSKARIVRRGDIPE